MIHCYYTIKQKHSVLSIVVFLASLGLSTGLGIAQKQPCSNHEAAFELTLNADVSALKQELDETRALLRKTRCSSFFESSDCKNLKRYEKSQAQALAKLQRKNILHYQSAAAAPAHKRIAKTDCDNKVKVSEDGKSHPTSNTPAIVVPKKPTANGDVRTMCVRLCDGYYYPISFPAQTRNFDRDGERCQNSCPGATTALFKHHVDKESETMVEVSSNTPYSEFENAFAYRQTSIIGCSCSASEKGERLVSNSQPRYRLWTISREQSPTQSVSTLQEKNIAQKQQRVPQISPRTEIRSVGPKFLPDLEDKIPLNRPFPAVAAE